jgi:uncharacterized protein with PIN domain
MNLTKSYIEGVKQRIELVRCAIACTPTAVNIETKELEYHLYQLLDYLEPIETFVEEEKMRCEICKNPLYKRSDGSLVCMEMTH